MPKKTTIHYELYKKIAINFFIISIVLCFLIIYFSYKKAEISVWPNHELVKTEFMVDVKPNPAKENELRGRILQTTLKETSVFETESYIEEPLEEVTAKIKIINNHSANQQLVATTRFLTESGILFRLNKYVMVPAQGFAEAEIRADEPEKITGEIPAGRITIPGLREALQDKIYGEMKEPIKPNLDQVKIIREDDISKAREKALETLSQKAILQFAKKIRSGEKILPKSIDKTIIAFTIGKNLNDKAEIFETSAEVKFTAVIFDEDELFAFGKHNLEQALAEGKIISEVKEDALIYTVEKYDLETETANIKISLTGKASIGIDNKILDKKNITGMIKEEALAYFQTFPEIKKTEIITTPSWWNRLPRLQSGIKINIRED